MCNTQTCVSSALLYVVLIVTISFFVIYESSKNASRIFWIIILAAFCHDW